MIDPIGVVYARLKGPENRQVWHTASVDGFELYLADTSFGDGPIFRASGNGHHASFGAPYGRFVPMSTDTTEADLDWIRPLLERAEWNDKLAEYQQKMGYQP